MIVRIVSNLEFRIWSQDTAKSYLKHKNINEWRILQLYIATKVKEVKSKKGYPLFFRPTWAKFSSDKIIPIAKQLQEVGLLRGVTLALQSLDDETLKIIKRENIKFGTRVRRLDNYIPKSKII